MEDVGQQGPDMAEDQYENDEFYREQQPKNNDLRIEEGEDEGEGNFVIFEKFEKLLFFSSSVIVIFFFSDEDDQLDYPNNNLKHEKHE